MGLAPLEAEIAGHQQHTRGIVRHIAPGRQLVGSLDFSHNQSYIPRALVQNLNGVVIHCLCL